MPVRRAHHKSRLGCLPCKKRRVKCDEGRPTCSKCKKRGIECSFPALDPPRPDRKAPGSVHVFALSPSPLSPLSPPSLWDSLSRDGLLDKLPAILKARSKHLLHHFATQTTTALSGDDQGKAALPRIVSRLAKGHPFILQGIFAVTSLHLSRFSSVESEQHAYYSIAQDQMGNGLVEYRKAIQNLNDDNAEALFIFSATINSFTTLAYADECKATIQSIQTGRLSSKQHEEKVDSLVHATTRLMRCLHGVLNILVPHWEQLLSSEASPILQKDWWPHPIPTTTQAIEDDRRLKDIEKLWARPGRRYQYQFDYLRAALKSLRQQFALVSQLTVAEDSGSSKILDWTSTISWLMEPPLEFISLIENRWPEAWIILAHYGIIFARRPEIWWLGTIASSLISTAALVLGEAQCDPISWPVAEAGIDLSQLRAPRLAEETETEI
ncbi:hypothetical protein BS50DRAFT_31807 [Corynespora cassiicola Philippines]|uniref:Zn(2)-C6 fungal-type domain-containing protein n=1 Tax=Corynespora cassiicola Philippines TaxID=1448308 RepID=A0A2T2PBN3_CORCC|nr:hypothetical protein BS50DRAFT_31807 [Corynespora cassiicola Philippines]